MLLISLIAFLVFPFIRKSAVIVDFYIHRTEIAAELCEQKDIPDSCCHGSCQLKKNLREAEDFNDDRGVLKDQTDLKLFYEAICFVPVGLDFSEDNPLGFVPDMYSQCIVDLTVPPPCGMIC